jgi:hypothetical protein
MAGFFGLFNSKTKYVDEADTDNSSEEFFLEPDEAKSLGNVEYMRKASVIKKTFPKTLSQEGGELIREVSSLSESKVSSEQNAPTSPGKTEGIIPAGSANIERRNPDDSMDIFRNMARELKK